MLIFGRNLKNHTEVPLKDGGVEFRCGLTGTSGASPGYSCSDSRCNKNRSTPGDSVATREETASYPHVTSGQAALKAVSLHPGRHRKTSRREGGGVVCGMSALGQRCAMPMREDRPSVERGVISATGNRRPLRETLALQCAPETASRT